uniref:Y-family DNA polymerase n=1 Tax=Pedobacter schmidteae TaxID=2201271 RepID=UPI000EAEE94C|nr:DNA polymerase Y family protein [Pedobacter schmidteae]
MQKRFLSIGFPYLSTDWLTIRQPELKTSPFVFAGKSRGRQVVIAANPIAMALGITINMPLADAKAIVSDLEVFDEKPGLELRLLKAIGLWCIRYTPIVAMDAPEGLFLDISGCTHLWGGEQAYLQSIVTVLQNKGYQVCAAIADTPGAAWAMARFGKYTLVASGAQYDALLPLVPAALRLEPLVLLRLQKLGLYQISNFIDMPRSVLRRRFGDQLLLRIHQALGNEEEIITPLQLPSPYQDRLPCLEPIRTAPGIETAIQKLLESLCGRLQQEGKGLRTASLKCFRVDGKVVTVSIGTNAPSHHVAHLFKLFALKIPQIEPALGIELFILEAGKVQDAPLFQEALWTNAPGLNDQKLAELLDRLSGKAGANIVHRYLPDEHYWPERAFKPASTIQEQPAISWPNDRPRPTQLLKRPEPIEVTAPIPDYPPMLFRYKGKIHHISKADGPERIEREWWLDKGEHRDYYYVEDESGQRYWLFRSGHYAGDRSNHWFIHGYFA